MAPQQEPLLMHFQTNKNNSIGNLFCNIKRTITSASKPKYLSFQVSTYLNQQVTEHVYKYPPGNHLTTLIRTSSYFSAHQTMKCSCITSFCTNLFSMVSHHNIRKPFTFDLT